MSTEPPVDNFHVRERIQWLAEQAIGPIEHQSARLFRGAMGGRTVWIESARAKGGQDRGLRIAVPFPDIPVRMQLHKRWGKVAGEASAQTVAVQFDHFVRGTFLPPEMRAALDDRWMTWLMSAFEPLGPKIGIGSKGRLACLHTMPNGGWYNGYDVPSVTPGHVRAWATGLLELADRLAAHHAQLYEAIAQAQGQSAAEAWLAAQREAAARDDVPRSALSLKGCLIIGAFLAGTGLIVAVVVVLFFLVS